MFTRFIITIVVSLSLIGSVGLRAGEHPEHPQKAKGEKKQVSTAEISTGIRENIEAESKKGSDGKFHLKHEGQDLALDLVKVHDDRLSDLGDGKYFACVDMKATDGKIYDVDFFLAGDPGAMKVTDTALHKIEGKPLYNWKEENGKWHKVPVG